MLKSYLKSALRSILRAKLFSFINIVGLGVGIAAAIIVALWVRNEFSYDRYNVNADRIYRVTSHWVYGSADYTMPWTAGPLADVLRQLPEVKYAVRLSMPVKDVVMKYENELFGTDDLFYTDPDFFKVFSIKLLEGDPKTALLAPNSIVLSRSIAKRLFNNEDPIGKTINVKAEDRNIDFVVTGVMEDFPKDSHYHAKSLASFSSIEKSDKYLSMWYSVGLYTYFLLAPNSGIESVKKALPLLVERYLGKWGEEQKWSFGLQRLTDIHLHSHLLGEIEPNGSIENVLIFGAIGLFVLLISVINFVSLSTARFADRAKEVGVRKVAGAARKELVIQFIVESVLVALLSGVLAVSVVELSLPYFNGLTDESLSLGVYGIGVAAIAFVLLGVVAGVYPALFVSSFKVTSIFRKEPVLKPAGVPLRKTLVAIQFAVAVGIIASTIIVSKQLNFVRSKNLGFNKDQVIVIPLRHDELRQKYLVLREAFSQLPGVEGVSGASGQLGNTNFLSNVWKGDKPLFQTRYFAVDFGFMKTMGIKLVSGRYFSPSIPSDTTSSILVNETAASKLRALGMFNDEFSIGGVYKNARVVGVMKDFNYRPLYYPVQPLVVFLQPSATRFMVERLSPGDFRNTVSSIEDTWKKIVPNYPLDWRFQDEAFEKAYRSDVTMEIMFEIGAFLSIFISVLGLFGLASYAVEKRLKEIGIRKVLGASIPDVIGLLTKDFALLVVIGGLVGCPIAYYFMEKWLQNFAFRIDITLVPFLLAEAIALAISLAIVGARAMKAAAANPTESLRYE